MTPARLRRSRWRAGRNDKVCGLFMSLSKLKVKKDMMDNRESTKAAEKRTQKLAVRIGKQITLVT